MDNATATRAPDERSSVEQLPALALSDPAGAIQQADELLADPSTAALDRARALWARGLGLRVQNDLLAARLALTDACDLAATGGAPVLDARIRSSLALVLAYLGDSNGALRAIDEAADYLDGPDAARNEMQRALILQRMGHHDRAEVAYGSALRVLRRHGDGSAEARLLLNRSNLRAYRGDLRGAEADLLRARDLAELNGDRLSVGLVVHNLGFVAGRSGDVLTALDRIEESISILRSLDVGPQRIAVAASDGAEILADAGLIDEAIVKTANVVRVLEASGNRTEQAEAELRHARMLLLAGRHDEAVTTAAAAAGRFLADGRDAWAAQARFVILSAELAMGSPADVEAAVSLADDLEDAGWRTEARRGRIGLAVHALQQGDVERALHLLEQIGTSRRDGPAIERLQQWHATALLRAANGERAGARRAVTAGLRVLDAYRMTFGSAELRAHAAAHGRGLVQLAVRLALEQRRPAEALVAVDAVRAAETVIAHRPPEDPALRQALVDLRRLDAEVRAALESGEDPRPVERQRTQIERRVRDLARVQSSAGRWQAHARLELPSLRGALADRILVSFVTLDDRLHRLVVTSRGVRHRELGPVEPIVGEIATLRFSLQRLVAATGRPAVADAVRASCQRSSDELNRLLRLDELRRGPDVVVVPSDTLHGLPWGALSSLSSRAVSVVPSARHWLAARSRVPASGQVTVASGPDLSAGEREAADVHRLYEKSQLLTGREATVAAVLEAMEGAAVAHLVAHGEFRADNPMFSSLRWADGRLTVYDLEQLRQPPQLIVLSSCDAANERAVAADAVLGMASALLRLGVRNLIAAVLPIADEATRPMMRALHERLVAGAAPGAALAETTSMIDEASPQGYALKRSFVHFGA